MQIRPPRLVRPHTQSLFLLHRHKNNFFGALAKEVICHINALATLHFVIQGEDFLTLLRVVPVKLHSELVKHKKLFLMLEPDGFNDVGALIASGGSYTNVTLSVRHVIRYFYFLNIDPDTGLPKTEINRLLHYLAFGHPDMACQMLEANPALLDQAGYVIAPTGDLLWDVKPFECVFSVCDHQPDMLPRLMEFLPRIKDGDAVYQAQYAKYKNALANIGKEARYAFEWIIDVVKQSSEEDDNAFLAQQFKTQSKLQRNVNQYWQHFPMRVITRGLVCRYADIHEAYQVLYNEIHDLYKRAGNSYRKVNVCWLLINWIINRRLCDRQAYARGYMPDAENNREASLERSYEFLHNAIQFFEPCIDFLVDDDADFIIGCGRSFGISLYGGAAAGIVLDARSCEVACGAWLRILENVCLAKTQYFQLAQNDTAADRQNSIDMAHNFLKRN